MLLFASKDEHDNAIVRQVASVGVTYLISKSTMLLRHVPCQATHFHHCVQQSLSLGRICIKWKQLNSFAFLCLTYLSLILILILISHFCSRPVQIILAAPFYLLFQNSKQIKNNTLFACKRSSHQRHAHGNSSKLPPALSTRTRTGYQHGQMQYMAAQSRRTASDNNDKRGPKHICPYQHLQRPIRADSVPRRECDGPSCPVGICTPATPPC